MDSARTVMKKGREHEIVIGLFLAAYIVSGVQTPVGLGATLNTTLGKIIIAALAVCSFFMFTPVVAVLFALSAFELVRRNEQKSAFELGAILGSEEGKSAQMTAYNQFPATLEEDMVKNMAPLVGEGVSGKADYQGVLSSGPDFSSLF
jgi:hypothetical protein